AALACGGFAQAFGEAEEQRQVGDVGGGRGGQREEPAGDADPHVPVVDLHLADLAPADRPAPAGDAAGGQRHVAEAHALAVVDGGDATGQQRRGHALVDVLPEIGDAVEELGQLLGAPVLAGDRVLVLAGGLDAVGAGADDLLEYLVDPVPAVHLRVVGLVGES